MFLLEEEIGFVSLAMVIHTFLLLLIILILKQIHDHRYTEQLPAYTN